MDREELLKEIFELEPDLRTKEKEVRTLVFFMLEHKPVIVPDSMMKAVVRARLMKEFETSTKMVKSPWTDWLWYAAPIGAAAVVILMMIPNYQGQPAPYIPPSPGAPVIRSGGETMSVPSMTMPVGESAAKMEMMDAGPEAVASDVRTFGTMGEPSIDVPNQKAGNVVKVNGVLSGTPVFVGVYAPGNTLPLGLSKLIVPGDTAPFTIGLNVPMRVGGSYEIILFVDNGDGVFNPASDTQSLVVPLSVLP